MPRMLKPVEWKRNYRKIPQFIFSRIASIEGNEVMVACVRKIPESDIRTGKFSHLGIKLDNENVVFPERVLPKPIMGKYSRTNIEGVEIVRKDLPMITKTYAVTTPNYGDWSYGSHDVYWDKQVYVREYVPPNLNEIAIELLVKESVHETIYVIKFTVEEVLDETSEHFTTDLLRNLNLLQENTGNVGVFKSEASIEDYLRTIYVNWEILPPGSREGDIAKIISRFKITSEEDKQRLVERYDVMSKLKPVAYIAGTSGFRRYFGAKFSEKLVVFENLEYGNALYVMYEDWETLSIKTRIDLLRGDNRGFDRIIHSRGWKTQLEYLVKTKLAQET